VDKQALIAALSAIYNDAKADAKLRADAKQKLINALGVKDLDEDRLSWAEGILGGEPETMDPAEFQEAFEIVNKDRLKAEAEAAKAVADAQAAEDAAKVLAAKEAAAAEEAKRLVAEMKRAAEELAKSAGL